MAIRGSLDAVERFQVRGWAFRSDEPQGVVTVEILRDATCLATVPANLYREDLEHSGIGDGHHAFIVNVASPLAEADLERISARAVLPEGGRFVLPLGPRASAEAPKAPPPSASPNLIEIEEIHPDQTQQPVFILGAARSGTSVMAQALLKLGSFDGNQEGHVFDLLAHFSVALDRFYRLKSDEAAGGRNTTVARVPRAFFHQQLDTGFVDLARRLFTKPRWVDKTPNSDLIHLAPRLRKIWPQSRFIFMRRRFLENAASRARKFPEYGFERNAREWAYAMEAWQGVKAELHGAAVEVDQKFLSEQPEEVGSRLARFLSLVPGEEARLLQALRFDRPERTSADRQQGYELSEMGWGEAERGTFAEYCAGLMASFGYSTDASYFLPGFETHGFLDV